MPLRRSSKSQVKEAEKREKERKEAEKREKERKEAERKKDKGNKNKGASISSQESANQDRQSSVSPQGILLSSSSSQRKPSEDHTISGDHPGSQVLDGKQQNCHEDEPKRKPTDLQLVSHTITSPCLLNIVASYPDLPAHMQVFMRGYFLSHWKAGRSGRFGDVMMMSPGHGLEKCLECEQVQTFSMFLGSKRYQTTLKTLKGKWSILCAMYVSKVGILTVFCVDCLQTVSYTHLTLPTIYSV